MYAVSIIHAASALLTIFILSQLTSFITEVVVQACKIFYSL